MYSKFKKAFSGLYVDGQGYKRFQDSGKLFHRYIAERVIGRHLAEGEVVHHVDGNKLNNRRANLQVMTRSEHWQKHHASDSHGSKIIWILKNYRLLLSLVMMAKKIWTREKNKRAQRNVR